MMAANKTKPNKILGWFSVVTSAEHMPEIHSGDV